MCLFVYQEKQDEAQYLREHRGELVEELAKTIVQKVRNKMIDFNDAPLTCEHSLYKATDVS